MPHHHHRHSLAGSRPPPAPWANAKGAAILHPPPVYPPGVQTWRQWGEPLTCTLLTLVAFNLMLKRLNVWVTDWGLAARGMVWSILLFALLAYMAIGSGSGPGGLPDPLVDLRAVLAACGLS